MTLEYYIIQRLHRLYMTFAWCCIFTFGISVAILLVRILTFLAFLDFNDGDGHDLSGG